MCVRDYDHARDRDDVHRIWREIGWISEDRHEAPMDVFLGCCKGVVAEVEGSVECVAGTMPASFRYLDEELSLSAVMGVTTSRVARKLGLARRLTAEVIARDARDGALLSALGVFDQGFYDQLGYGTGPYVHLVSFDPARLKVRSKFRVPQRLGVDDWEQIHRALLKRARYHGSCNILPPGFTRAELQWSEKDFGLGYRDPDTGELTHFIWGSAKGENGPYRISFIAFRNRDQFLELTALLRSLGDQVHMIRIKEPPQVQFQDLLDEPFRTRNVTRRSEFETTCTALAYWQLRICDLPGCLERTHIPGGDLRFNLRLADPVESFLPEDSDWRGISGEYAVRLGPESSAEREAAPGLMTLNATVGAFTRLWMGARSASSLCYTNELEGPDELIAALDETLLLPTPNLDWDF